MMNAILKREFGSFGLRAISGMNTGENIPGANNLAGFGEPIHAHVVIDGRFFCEPPATEVADDFADDARVAFGNPTGFSRLDFDNHRRGRIKRGDSDG